MIGVPRIGRGRQGEADMKLRWIALIAALAIPALGWAASSVTKASNDCGCPICPLVHR